MLHRGAARYQILVPSYTVMFAFMLVLTVGWLLPMGSMRLHEHAVPAEAIIENSRSRTGSARAAKAAVVTRAMGRTVRPRLKPARPRTQKKTATTQKPRAVIDTISRYYESQNANIHRGVYYLSQLATDLYEQARVKVQSAPL